MTDFQAVADILDETVEALAVLDSDSLRTLEERAATLAQSSLIFNEAGLSSILAKRRVLELVLGDSASNLNALNRLYGRNTRVPWEH